MGCGNLRMLCHYLNIGLGILTRVTVENKRECQANGVNVITVENKRCSNNSKRFLIR
jgi:hypothetical protein